MNTTKKNLNSLPDMCFSVSLVNGALTRIIVGEMGYYPVTLEDYKEQLKEVKGSVNDLADMLNQELNIDFATRVAMEIGSQFGWDKRGANPSEYQMLLGTEDFKQTT